MNTTTLKTGRLDGQVVACGIGHGTVCPGVTLAMCFHCFDGVAAMDLDFEIGLTPAVPTSTRSAFAQPHPATVVAARGMAVADMLMSGVFDLTVPEFNG